MIDMGDAVQRAVAAQVSETERHADAEAIRAIVADIERGLNTNDADVITTATGNRVPEMLALYRLVRRDGGWWIAARHNTAVA